MSDLEKDRGQRGTVRRHGPLYHAAHSRCPSFAANSAAVAKPINPEHPALALLMRRKELQIV